MKKTSLRTGLLATTTLCTVILSTLGGAALVAVTPSLASAQDFTNGTLSGTVKSNSGSPDAGATVTVTGQSNAYTATATTAADGTFTMNQIPIGSYQVDITTADGGKASENVTVTLGSVSSYDFVAGGSDNSTTVVVRGKARRNIDFNRTTTGQVIDVQSLANKIPVGRSLNALADTVPGISINDSFGVPPVGQPSISGASPAENIYYIDGMNVTNFRNFLGGSTVPFDFYDQIEVKTGGYSAEYGRSTGGAFIATSRSGSNTFHGGISYYYAPKSLSTKGATAAKDLNAELTDSDGNPIGPDPRYTTFRNEDNTESTMWLSGPIWKDHILFFGMYNPRDLTFSFTDTGQDGTLKKYAPSVNKDPFYGGKLTFMLNPNQRLDVTYINDDQTRFDHNIDPTGKDSLVRTSAGGLTRVFNYRGKFTDWFTLSAMYGSSSFNQSIISSEDADPAVFLGGDIVRGNPALTVATGKDYRKNYRVDADFYFDLLGHHHLRVGADREKLNAIAHTFYSGNAYYRYYDVPAGGTVSCGGFADTTSCVRYRVLNGGGSFNVINDAWYLEDDWALTDRLNLNLGVRNDTFDNRNAANISFIKSQDLWSPRLGLSYDLKGDKTTKLTASYGRYYLPIAANTNIRMAGGESFTEKYYTWTTRDPNTLVPVLSDANWLNPDPADYVLEDGSVPGAATLVSHNIEPQYEDEFTLGYERRMDNGWKIGAHYLWRKLANVMEDTDLTESDHDPCVSLGIPEDQCGTFGSSNYVLINPGKDIIVTLGDSFGPDWAGKTVTIKASDNGLPQAKRLYEALEFDVERPDDGKWFLGGSLTLSKSIGNIEGGVKSDNGQTDTGLTQDFDQVGWTDGSYGLLPNHHGLSLKAYGTYHYNDKLDFGFNAAVLSPRHYGCIGYYPDLGDGRADSQTLTAWYCDGKLTPRGSQFKGDWINRLDISATYTQTLPYGTLKYGVDIFNLFDAQGANILGEQGEISGPGNPNLNYKQPLSYQEPRYMRLSLRYAF